MKAIAVILLYSNVLPSVYVMKTANIMIFERELCSSVQGITSLAIFKHNSLLIELFRSKC